MLTVNKQRFIETMKTQAEFGATETDGELNRPAPSDAAKAVYDWFCTAMEQEDLDIRIDRIGNIFGRRAGTDPDLSPVLIGSHLDSHAGGGIYDGALGVIAALELIRTLNDEDVDTRRPIEIVSWFNEEGSRFPPSTMGSRVWTGNMRLAEAYAATDADGMKLEDELKRIGYQGEIPAEPTKSYESYFELHIEQSNYLHTNGLDVGVVSGIVGLARGEITYDGETNHSGGTRMHHRKDALVGAADVVTQVRRFPGTLGERTVATVGQLDVSPNNRNAVPGTVRFTWEVRDPSDDVIDTAERRIKKEVEHVADRENLEYDSKRLEKSESIDLDEDCFETIRIAAEEMGYEYMPIFSGGGHDAQHVMDVCPAGMVFAVNESGKSHTPEEYTSWDNCYKAANVLGNAVLQAATRES